MSFKERNNLACYLHGTNSEILLQCVNLFQTVYLFCVKRYGFGTKPIDLYILLYVFYCVNEHYYQLDSHTPFSTRSLPELPIRDRIDFATSMSESFIH